ncbi:unnamed protein product [Mycena citricolor]|uniref:Nuclear protein localization n=1 Tax=Mycena citricolor TaxID=2018698 RepID=A0AAD2Q239_9AGAR|nr:unnamed protein product [Mycena citricolor]
MSALPKIVIKPRSSAAVQGTILAREEEEEEEEKLDSVAHEGDTDAEADDGTEDAPTPMEIDDPIPTATPEEAPAVVPPVKRGRGRPRGSGKKALLGHAPVGSAVPGTSTPRGRGRGRGRPPLRARGMARAAGGVGFTIRLPKRDDESDEDGSERGADVDMGAVGEEGPIGGGRPFRTIQGKAYIIEGDEFITENDPKGDEKIDQWGNLLGDRKFKAATFVLPGRHPERRYMLAIDAARTSGFRDSLYYFRRNPLALKQNATQPEKDYLISQGKLGTHLRTRSVTLVTARSAFKLHGSKTIIDGRWVVDDYYEDRVLEEITARGLQAGDPVGELPDPNANAANAADAGLGANTAANKTDRGGGTSVGVYRAGGPTTLFGSSGWGPYSDGPLNAVRKSLLSRDGVSEENWMLMAATRTLAADAEWAKWRKEGIQPIDGSGNAVKRKTDDAPEADSSEQLPLGTYEPHTSIVHYRNDTQPTRSRMEAMPDSAEKAVLGGTKSGNGAWAIAWIDTVMDVRIQEELERSEADEKMNIWKDTEEGILDDDLL